MEATSRSHLRLQLELTELLLSLAEESAVRQRARAESGDLTGEALGRALMDLALIESSAAGRKAERKRLLTALAALPP